MKNRVRMFLKYPKTGPEGQETKNSRMLWQKLCVSFNQVLLQQWLKVEERAIKVENLVEDISMQETIQPEGMPDQPGTPQVDAVGMSFEELRARLPATITDDIVILLSQSGQALEDFATIQTQQDVDNFNTKYNVNLVLPSEG